MKVAVIGTGISGLTSAYLLHKSCDIHLFEAADRIGGHTATVDVNYLGRDYAIDTGFIVYNDWTYPNFIKLMDRLGIESQPTEMSFSVSCRNTGLEYGGNNVNSLFAQRRNIANIPYLRMLMNIIRFNKEAIRDLESGNIAESITLAQYLQANGYGELFASHYLVPMGSAIWSATLQSMLQFPLLFFVRFFKNHGLLSVSNRPQWRVLKGGSRAYLKPLSAPFADRIQLNSKIEHVQRESDRVVITFVGGHSQIFDQVIFACHSDQALALLADASEQELDVLGAIPYRNNEVTLHTDSTILPAAKAAWSSWNYHLGKKSDKPPALSYNMNILQGIESDTTFVVTLNASELVDKNKILAQFNYAHPVFSLKAIAAQARWQEINGVNKTWFCGAYWQNGFHEDGCVSGIRVAKALGAEWD